MPPAPLRQLDADTLVAAVATLRVLLLLNRVNAELEVARLELEDMELLQLPDLRELALEDTASPRAG